MLHTWKPQLKRCYSLIEPSATSTSTRLFNWIFLSCQRDRHPFYACCVWLLVFCTFARFHGICLGNKVARARIKVMNGFPRGPTTTSILVTSSSIQKWIWPGLLWLVDLNYNFECDWLIELPDNNLESEFFENRSFFEAMTIEKIEILISNDANVWAVRN